MGMFKAMKDHTPISVYDMFNLGQRNKLLVNLPSIQLNVSRYNFANQCSLIWNIFIGRVLQKSNADKNGVLILGSALNSDFCAPIPFVNNKLRSILLEYQKLGTQIYGNPQIFVKAK